jgi:hypothetical protein
MEYQNITLSIPKDVLKKARIIAIQHGQSLSGIVTEYIRKIVENDAAYQQAYQRQTRSMEQGFDLKSESTSHFDREALHERR